MTPARIIEAALFAQSCVVSLCGVANKLKGKFSFEFQY